MQGLECWPTLWILSKKCYLSRLIICFSLQVTSSWLTHSFSAILLAIAFDKGAIDGKL